MLEATRFMIVHVDARLNPKAVAASVQSSLAEQHPKACWIHAQDDLEPVLRFAQDHEEHPLVVTTETIEWSPLEFSRNWIRREGSIAFVLMEGRVPDLPPQVSRVLVPHSVSRRHLLLAPQDLLHPLVTSARTLMARLSSDVDELRLVATNVGVCWERIKASGSVEIVAMHIVDEALRSDLLPELVEHIHLRYRDNDSIAMLLGDVLAACELGD